MDEVLTIVLASLIAIALIIFFYYVPFMLWINAVVSGVHISLVQLFLMRIRKVPPAKIVNCMIEAHKAGLMEVKRDGLEAHYLAGGHIERVVHALVSASKAGIDLSFQMATAIDLAGRDVRRSPTFSIQRIPSSTPPASTPTAVCSNPCSQRRTPSYRTP